jgi:hypothetical protein
MSAQENEWFRMTPQRPPEKNLSLLDTIITPYPTITDPLTMTGTTMINGRWICASRS